LATKPNELKDILQSLSTLQSRVEELTSHENDVQENPQAPVEKLEPSAMGAPAGWDKAAVDAMDSNIIIAPMGVDGRGDIGADNMALLRAGISELSAMTTLKDFPMYFSRIAERTGLRMLLLKRWTSGMQVFLEQNIKMPVEAKRKRQDGRAPIPSVKGDIFEAVGEEATVYCGPVPAKHFPLDLTLMLGRGSRDRQIVILPIPAKNHWNTFIYLDADMATEKQLGVAEVLAHYALTRMSLLNKGIRQQQGRVQGILKSELYRRKKSQARRIQMDLSDPLNEDDEQSALVPGPNESNPPSDDLDSPGSGETMQFVNPPKIVPSGQNVDVDPFEDDQREEGLRGNQKYPLVPPAAKPVLENAAIETIEKVDPRSAAALPDDDNFGLAGLTGLTPELILHQSGELPALPKVACHIMAVIEDPRTTATRLEKALAMDQTLTAKVLRIANSPFYGAVREISTVSEAIVRLGFVTIRNWTLVTATKSVFLAPGAGLLFQKIWRQSVMSAMAGQLVAQAVGGKEPESVFIGGLMQNIGQLVLARNHPEIFQDIVTKSGEKGLPYHEVERNYLGFDHGELGSLLIKDWNLSQDLEDAVHWHHRFDHEDAKNAQVAAMIALGEEIALTSTGAAAESAQDNGVDDTANTEFNEENLPPLSSAAAFLGLTKTRFAALKKQAEELHIDPHFFS
jgi:HD-like signal output (HDOD) protein